MTDMDQPTGAEARERLDDDDHDLLTFREAGERLRIEIARTQSELDAMTADCDAETLGSARNRLAALVAARRRNSAHAINDANFEQFFGYPRDAKHAVSITEPEDRSG